MFSRKANELREKFSLANLVKANLSDFNTTIDDQLFQLYKLPKENGKGNNLQRMSPPSEKNFKQADDEEKKEEEDVKESNDFIPLPSKSTNPFEDSNDSNNFINSQHYEVLESKDTPLKRFLDRRFGSRSLSDSCVSPAPRSEEEIMSELDHDFYTSDFDPIKHMLDSLPNGKDRKGRDVDYVAYLDKEISEKDVALRRVMADLSDKVQEHYNDLVGGMKFVQQVDIGLAQAGVQVSNSRRKLGTARENLVAGVLQAVGKRHRRDRMYQLVGVARQARAVLKIEKDVTRHIDSGDFSAAVEAAADARLAVEKGVMAEIMLLDQMRDRLDAMLPRIAKKTDAVLGGIVTRAGQLAPEFVFDAMEYEAIVQAYMVLDDHGVSAGQMQEQIHSPMSGLSGLAELIKSFMRKEAEECLVYWVKKGLENASTKAPLFQGYSPSTSDLCGFLPVSQLVSISLGFCGACASLLHFYYLLVQWHRCPFSEENRQIQYLYRCRVDHTQEVETSLPAKVADFEAAQEDLEGDQSERSGASDAANAFSQVLEDTQLLKERRKQHERARLNVVYHGLQQGRRVVWECIQAKAVTLLTGQDLAQASLRSEDLAAILSSFYLLMAFGQEFSSTKESASLSGCLGLKCRQFFAALQSEALDTLRQMLDREAWGRVPVKIQGQDHHGLQILVSAYKREIKWQSNYSTWGRFQDLMNNHSNGHSLFMRWHQIGNPFKIKALSVEEESPDSTSSCKMPQLVNTSQESYLDEAPEYDREEDEIFAEIERFGSRWIVTQAALNGVTLYLGRYLQVMELAPPVALEVFQGMCQLVDFYLFVVFTLFVPEQRIAALLGHGEEVDQLLSCEEEELAALRGFVARAAVGAGRTFSGKTKRGKSASAPPMHRRAQQRSVSANRNGGAPGLFEDVNRRTQKEEGSVGSRLSMLPEYVVAAESCTFVASVLLSILPQVLEYVPEAQKQRCEKYVESIQSAVEQLKIFIYRSISPYLIDSSKIIEIIQQQDWLKKKIQNHENPYINDIIRSCEEVWRTLQTGVWTDSLNVIPCSVREMIWLEVVQSVMAAFVEGFSRIKKCSTEGRALMSMDLQALQLGLDEIKRTRPLRGRVYVDSYIKAFYYGDADLIRWIKESWRSYHPSQMISLASCGTAGKMRRRKVKDIVTQVEALYPNAKNTESNSTIR